MKRVPIYYKVIIANSVMALTVITTLLISSTALVAGVVVVACGIMNALLVRAAFAVEAQHRSQRQLLAWTMDRSEQERSRLASQLQDDAAQRLAALVLKAAGDPAISQEAAAVMEELCDAAQALHPPGIRHAGLRGALGWYARSLERRFDVTIDLRADAELENLEQSLALGIYRILEDVLEHAVEHAPGRLDLYVTRKDPLVQADARLSYTMPPNERFRLTERTAVLGGQTRITDRDGETVVNLLIPMLEREPHAGYDSRLAG